MKIAICFIGTCVYKKFFPGYYGSIFNKFLRNSDKTIFAFTDDVNDKVFDRANVRLFQIQHKGWPENTLFRYAYIDSVLEELEKFDYFIFIDPDMQVFSQIKENEIINDKNFIGVQHPSFNNKDFDFRIGTFENRKESKAFVDLEKDDVSNYFQGCLWGGKIPYVLEMIRELKNNVDEDEKKGIRALWFDESHLNRFMIDNKKDVHILNSGYCYPEKWNINFEKKIIHLDKDYLNIKK